MLLFISLKPDRLVEPFKRICSASFKSCNVVLLLPQASPKSHFSRCAMSNVFFFLEYKGAPIMSPFFVDLRKGFLSIVGGGTVLKLLLGIPCFSCRLSSLVSSFACPQSPLRGSPLLVKVVSTSRPAVKAEGDNKKYRYFSFFFAF